MDRLNSIKRFKENVSTQGSKRSSRAVKRVDTDVNVFLDDSVENEQGLSYMDQGSGDYQRIGNSITYQSAEVMLTIRTNDLWIQANAKRAYIPASTCVVAVVYDRQGGDELTWDKVFNCIDDNGGDILGLTKAFDGTNINWSNRYLILKKWTISLPALRTDDKGYISNIMPVGEWCSVLKWWGEGVEGLRASYEIGNRTPLMGMISVLAIGEFPEEATPWKLYGRGRIRYRD